MGAVLTHDYVTGGKHADIIALGPGNDRIAGAGGKDHLYGGDGDDLVYGGGNDIIHGDADGCRYRRAERGQFPARVEGVRPFGPPRELGCGLLLNNPVLRLKFASGGRTLVSYR
jgi:RTX calcium-binding nonapeptide repeat (4 copies)